MRSGSQLLWPILAPPERDDCAPVPDSPCWLCGAPWPRGQLVSKWSGASFTGQNRVRCPTSTYVCEPCVQVCSRIAPVPGRPPKPGKKFGGNFRNYSHLYEAGDYVNASKGEKPAVLAFLRRTKSGPWFGAIADSGQKHVLPWVPVNPGRRGVVLFDEMLVQVPESFDLVDAMTSLLTAGATKDEIIRGDYRAQTWIRCRVEVSAFEAQHREERGGAWFGLALWLAQRDEEAVQVRLKKERESKRGKTKRRGSRRAANKDGRGDSVRKGAVPRSRRQPAEALGAAADAGNVERQKGNQPGRMDHASVARPTSGVGEQVGLPGIG